MKSLLVSGTLIYPVGVAYQTILLWRPVIMCSLTVMFLLLLLAKTLGIATPRKPVLSVSARKLKDNAADWHNLILKWDSLSDKGFTTASSIANLKVSLL